MRKADPREEFYGTKRELEILKRQRRASMSVTPRYRTLSMDATVFVDSDGVLYFQGHVVGQCIPGGTK